jgi:hypothetical protein
MLYVDVQGFVNGKPLYQKWKRISLDEIHQWRATEKLDFYMKSIQIFNSMEKLEDDPHILPLIFDFDNKDDPSKSLDDARTLLNHLKALYEDKLDIHIWFSGNKGFHVSINHLHFGVKVDKHSTYYMRYVAEYFYNKLHLSTLDRGMYKIPAMLRMANTPNKELFKIPLRHSEFLTMTMDQIKELAKKKRDVDYYDNEIDAEIIPELNQLYHQAKDEYNRNKKLEVPKHSPVDINNDAVPACITYLFDNGGILKLGMRNRTSMVVSCYCKDVGMDMDTAKNFISEWLKTLPSPSPLTSVDSWQTRYNAAEMVLKTVFASDKYHFGCGSIKDCGTPNDCCVGCISIGEKSKVIHFSEYAHKDNIGGKLLEFEADVVGKDKTEMLIPHVIKGSCIFDPDGTKCSNCDMANYFDVEESKCHRTVIVNAKSAKIIDIADQTAGNLGVVIRGLFGTQQNRCPNFQYAIEWQNAQKVHLSTLLNHSFVDTKDDKYFGSSAIVLAHGVEMNRGYKMMGRVYPNYRTRGATLIIEKIEPLLSMLDDFKLTDPQREELKVFQPDKSDQKSIMTKIRDIHSKFRDSFIFIFGRDNLILAEDLVFHSVRRINFQRQIKKAWLDILIIGDTRQGKTEIAKKLMNYYQIGTIASGETSSRTGLLYTIQMTKEEANWVRFGLMPRSNGLLLVVDEIHGMPPDDFKEFTSVRSEGELDVIRAGTGKVACEVRLICIANPRQGTNMSSYGYPVQSITEIPAFTSLEDVSRFTYAYGVKAGDVSDDELNRDVNLIPVEAHQYTKERCRNLILWLWTLRPDQIIIPPETEQTTLELAKQMSTEYIPDIPLVESADVRQKLIIVATAIAGRTYSTTEDGSKLLVMPDHVLCAYDVLTEFYKDDGLDYWGFSDDQARLVLTPEQIDTLEKKLITEIPIWETVIRYMLTNNQFNKTLLFQSTGISKEVSDKIITTFLNYNMLKSARMGFIRKTPSGRNFMRGMIKKYSASEIAMVEDNEESDSLLGKEDGF